MCSLGEKAGGGEDGRGVGGMVVLRGEDARREGGGNFGGRRDRGAAGLGLAHLEDLGLLQET